MQTAGASVAPLGSAVTAPGTPRKKAAVAGPVASGRREPVNDPMVDTYLEIITNSLSDDKGEDIVVLDLTGRAAFADRMVIATGLADRQITAMASHIERKLREVGLKRVLIEGANGSDWVLIDAGDIIVHLFKAEARAMYGLERMWGKELDVPPEESAEPLG
ncbi:ribosome silencing factor [Novacetimonas pomaceti]|uniref:Ribosomal silencing factor RsfS n=1 Tax=Novacetimonas pomaceti TaxID=2021998 RepID=A0ABX5P1L8_9PROT|nr:ribosome silencing factor [Novacetimonas pomaceti]PYD47084.1 ribosome silencing factor [Novacetimonas pomaceti]